MSRTPQKKADKGSQKWLQLLINDRPDLLNALVRSAIKSPARLTLSDTTNWVSPLETDEYAEYRDGDFLDKLGIDSAALKTPLRDFWPALGPVWDGLGKNTRGDLLLVEAKAHFPEMASKSSATAPASVAKIDHALQQTKAVFAPHSQADWAAQHYQWANRLAHLYWLRELNGLPAYMVFVYFCGDTEMNGPETRQEWKAAIAVRDALMGVDQDKPNPLSPFVLDIFVEVSDLQ